MKIKILMLSVAVYILNSLSSQAQFPPSVDKELIQLVLIGEDLVKPAHKSFEKKFNDLKLRRKTIENLLAEGWKLKSIAYKGEIIVFHVESYFLKITQNGKVRYQKVPPNYEKKHP